MLEFPFWRWILNGIGLVDKSISELVTNGENGHLFKDSDELAKRLISTMNDFPKSLVCLQNGVEDYHSQLGWEECWNRDLLPLLEN